MKAYLTSNVRRATSGDHAVTLWEIHSPDRRDIYTLSETDKLVRLLADLYHYARLHGIDSGIVLSRARQIADHEAETADLAPIPDWTPNGDTA